MADNPVGHIAAEAAAGDAHAVAVDQALGDEVVDAVDDVVELGRGVGVLAEEYEMVWFPGDDLFAASQPRGLPIGNLTSQFWANCYLNPFDHFVERELRCRGYVRYVDDCLLFANDKRTI